MAYCAGDFKSKTNLSNIEAAAFSVNKLKKVRNEDECLTMTGPLFYEDAHTETIDGSNFRVAKTDGVGLGHLVYKAYQQKKCFQLDLRITCSNIGNFYPGTVYTGIYG